MIRLLLLAALAISTSSARAAVLAADRVPARRGEVVATALERSQNEPAASAPTRCPYHFGSDMPAATFCVYSGIALGGSGEVCATDVVVIWSALVSQAAESAARAGKASGSNREVYLAFVADPELVLRAIVDSRQVDRAEMVEYTVGSDGTPQPLAGDTSLRTAPREGTTAADVLTVALRDPRRFHPGSCAFASYSGTFLGMIQPPSATTISVDVPRH